MEQDKNKRLNELFKQAKNEPPKTSFSDVKEQFMNSSTSISNVSKGGKLSQFTNLKFIIMTTTIISSIVVGTVMFIGNSPNNKTTSIEANVSATNTEEKLSDSVIILNEHKQAVKAYTKRTAIKRVDKEIEQTETPIITENTKLEQQVDTLKTKKAVNTTVAKHHIDTNYRFPTLNEEEQKAQKKQKARMLKQLMKLDKKKYAFIPSGNLSIKDKKVSVEAFYMQTTEVTNLEYRTFLFDLLAQGREDDFMIAKPEQSMWVKEYPSAYLKPMEEHYFSHPAYNDYPVVAISRKGAEMYCKWLTQETNKLNKEKNKSLINNLRIPTDYEWMYAAKGELKKSPYPWGGPYLRNAKGCYLANYKPLKNDYKADGAFSTAKVNSYHPNDYGLFCMSGNVAEMIYYSENNLAGTKGGSWTSIGQELQIVEGKDRFKGKINPSINVGFRPVFTHIKQ